MIEKNGKASNAVKQQTNSKRKPTPASWKPGQSGNPNGRPPAGWSWAELLREAGEEIEPKSGKKFKELVSKKLWDECLKGNTRAIKDLMNRMDGYPKQSMELEGEVGVKPIMGGSSGIHSNHGISEDSPTDKKD